MCVSAEVCALTQPVERIFTKSCIFAHMQLGKYLYRFASTQTKIYQVCFYIFISTYICKHVCISASHDLPTYLSIQFSSYLSIYLSIFGSLYQSHSVYIQLSIYLLLCLYLSGCIHTTLPTIFFIYISWSCYAASTDIPESLPFVSIVYRIWQVLQTTPWSIQSCCR